MRNNGYMPPTEDGGDVVPSASANNGPSSGIVADDGNDDDISGGGTAAMMRQAMQRQDGVIDQLSAGLGRLRDQSWAIHDEAGLHSRLLDDMEVNMDVAHEVLGAEARRAAQLREDGSVWRLQLIVAGLSVSFVLLVLLGHM